MNINTLAAYLAESLMSGVIAGAIVYLIIRYRKLSDTLTTVRMATYDLTKMLDDAVGDLRDSLIDAGIPLCTKRLEEAMRRASLSPQERYDESLARFEETAKMARRLGETL